MNSVERFRVADVQEQVAIANRARRESEAWGDLALRWLEDKINRPSMKVVNMRCGAKGKVHYATDGLVRLCMNSSSKAEKTITSDPVTCKICLKRKDSDKTTVGTVFKLAKGEPVCGWDYDDTRLTDVMVPCLDSLDVIPYPFSNSTIKGFTGYYDQEGGPYVEYEWYQMASLRAFSVDEIVDLIVVLEDSSVRSIDELCKRRGLNQIAFDLISAMRLRYRAGVLACKPDKDGGLEIWQS